MDIGDGETPEEGGDDSGGDGGGSVLCCVPSAAAMINGVQNQKVVRGRGVLFTAAVVAGGRRSASR